jgi:type IV pilus assembly protein PilY1
MKIKIDKLIKNTFVVTALLSGGLKSGSVFSEPAQYPLFIANPVTPIMMLNMSRDHQLFFKLYDDYSVIIDASGSDTGLLPSESDGLADTTYNHRYAYYGYFDSHKCYEYSVDEGYFSPDSYVNDERYCTGKWSGNFLNWATMTRLDAVRKILYGGKRYKDTSTETILERAFIPEDGHAFAKYYNGADIAGLTPFSPAGGITICNATSPNDNDRGGNDDLLSQNVAANKNYPPLIKVASGDYTLWASNEGEQCRWGVGSNNNAPRLSELNANSMSPSLGTNKLGLGNYHARIKVCVSKELINAINEENCKSYGNNYKPIGLLQEYGEQRTIDFGLMSGGFVRNKTGGVLRKNVGVITDEVNVDNGTFAVGNNEKTQGIISFFDALSIVGYNYKSGATRYNDSDSCPWGLSSFENGSCTSWGNPQSEIYLESLRYLAGLPRAQEGDGKNYVLDNKKIPGLIEASWVKPIGQKNYCAPVNILQFNASTSSYDTDELSDVSALSFSGDLSGYTVNTLLDFIGEKENISGKHFVGIAGTTDDLKDQLCTPKMISKLSAVSGTCPDAPRLEGGYQIASLAYAARESGLSIPAINTFLRSNNLKQPKVHTYGVSLAPAVPKVDVPVPGGRDEKRKVTIMPACRNTTTDTPTNCAIVDFKVVNQSQSSSANKGTLYVNWEDSEQGGDFDQDMWGLIKYEVTPTQLIVKTRVFAQATDQSLGFGYVIGGTANDSFHVQSGINEFRYGNYCGERREAAAVNDQGESEQMGLECTCRSSWEGACEDDHSVWRVRKFSLSSGANSETKSLDPPLSYAAKWGGYPEDGMSPDDIAQSVTKNYFYATDPRQLAQSLRNVFNNIANREGSASGVATNSTSLTEGKYLYQASFNSTNWTGSLRAYQFDAEGNFVLTNEKLAPQSTTDRVQPSPLNRNIYTGIVSEGNSSISVEKFSWANLSKDQKAYFIAPTDPENSVEMAQKRVRWLIGYDDDEVKEGYGGVDRLRSRGEKDRNIIGDIVNSTPVYSGSTNQRYHRLPKGGSKYEEYLGRKKEKTPKVIVGSNHGILHVFNANTLEEEYAYIPSLVYPKLRYVMDQHYGKSTNAHQYVLDGPLTVGDVFDDVKQKWITIVTGTLGAGGKGIFAIDITEDEKPSVLFELSEKDIPQLGYMTGKPHITPLANGRWGIVVGNGSYAESTDSHLLIIDIFDPKNSSEVITAKEGKGISALAILPDAIGQASIVYASDLNGSMWKFDLRSSLSDQWKLDYKLYHAKTTQGKDQPITAAPTLGVNSERGGAITVYFATGKYIDDGDRRLSKDNPYHSIYAVTDPGFTVTTGLVSKTISPPDSTGLKRDISNTIIDWSDDSVHGWRLDFGADEERVITKPVLLGDRLIIVTIVPSSEACDYGGKSWILEISATGTKFKNYQVLKEPTTVMPMTTAAPGFGINKAGASFLLNDIQGNPIIMGATQPPKSIGRQSWREVD